MGACFVFKQARGIIDGFDMILHDVGAVCLQLWLFALS